jgi:asparagine synthase (glutamine-hydrolysing)
LKPLIPKLVRQGWQWLRGQSQPEQSPTPLVNRCFAERIGLDARIRTLNHTSQPPLAVREYHWRALTQGALTFNLEQMDRYAAAFSIEARHPFLDKRLIEFCLALPSEQKLNQGWSRVVMRRALANVLPDVIQWRGGKTSMQPNFFHGMLKRDRHLLDETMDQLGRFETYIDTDVLRQAYQRMISGGKVGDWEGMMVWQAVILTSWFRRSQVMP